MDSVSVLPIKNPEGIYVPLGRLANIYETSGRYVILHDGARRVQTIALNVAGGDVNAFVLTNRRNLLLVLVNLPFALVGGVLAVFAGEGMLSLGAMVGFVTLFGITLRNSIMLISHYEHLVGVEGMEWGYPTAARGASERLAPILMTALVTALGLLPLAIGSSSPGQEIEGPLAIVILGGLMTSTALNLLVLPTLALRYGRFERQLDEK
jgi:Cu/Ag efflux pump CusA